MVKHDFNVFTGTETGILKGINLNKEAIITKNFNQAKTSDSNQEIFSLSWGPGNNHDEILVGCKDQTVSTYDTTCNCYTDTKKFNFGEGPLVSAFPLKDATIVGLATGEVAVVNGDESIIIKTISGKERHDKNQKKPTLQCVEPNFNVDSQLATGGCENNMTLWDVNRPDKELFKAKNVPPDTLDLRVPVWVRGLTFLPKSHCIATCSKYKTVRLYDPRAQRRPVINFEWEDHPLTSITHVPFAEHQLMVGSSYGRIAHFDLRKTNAKSMKSSVSVYKGIVGAVRDISVHPSLPLVFSVSLDRFLRVHHMETKNMIYKHFLSSRLNCMLVQEKLEEKDFELDEDDHRSLPETLPISNENSEQKRKRNRRSSKIAKKAKSA